MICEQSSIDQRLFDLFSLVSRKYFFHLLLSAKLTEITSWCINYARNSLPYLSGSPTDGSSAVVSANVEPASGVITHDGEPALRTVFG